MSLRRRSQPWISFVFRRDDTSQTLHGRDGVDGSRDDLTGARALRLVAQPAFQQLGVGEDHPELIIQSMEQPREIGLGRIHRSWECSSCASARHAPLRRRSFHSTLGTCVLPGSRQSVSAKMRTDPPAVRTYSTFPPASQL